MEKKLIINFQEYLDTVEKLAIEVNKEFKPTVLVGIMRGAAPIIDILSRIFKLPTAYIVIQSYSGKGLEDKQGDLVFARDISSIAEQKDFEKVLLVDDLSDTGLTLNKSIEWLKNYGPTKNFITEGLKDAADDDLILISDVDEIPNIKEINLKNLKEKLIFFNQEMFY